MNTKALIVVSANSVEFDREIGGNRWGSYVIKEPNLLDREAFLKEGKVIAIPENKDLLISTNLPDGVISIVKSLLADLDDVQQHYIICPVISRKGYPDQVQIGVTGTANSILDAVSNTRKIDYYHTCKREVAEELLLSLSHFVLKKCQGKREKGTTWYCTDVTVDDITMHHIAPDLKALAREKSYPSNFLEHDLRKKKVAAIIHGDIRHMLDVYEMSKHARDVQPGYDNDGITDVALLSLPLVAEVISMARPRRLLTRSIINDFYTCEMCGKEWNSRKAAEVCEKRCIHLCEKKEKSMKLSIPKIVFLYETVTVDDILSVYQYSLNEGRMLVSIFGDNHEFSRECDNATTFSDYLERVSASPCRVLLLLEYDNQNESIGHRQTKIFRKLEDSMTSSPRKFNNIVTRGFDERNMLIGLPSDSQETRIEKRELLYYHSDYPDMTFPQIWEKRMKNLSKSNRTFTREIFVESYIGSVYHAIKCGSFDLDDAALLPEVCNHLESFQMKQMILSRIQSLQRYMAEKPFLTKGMDIDPHILDRLKDIWSHITDWFILKQIFDVSNPFTEIVVLAGESHATSLRRFMSGLSSNKRIVELLNAVSARMDPSKCAEVRVYQGKLL